MKPIENEKQLPEPDHVDKTPGAPPIVKPEEPDISDAGELDYGDD